MTKKLKVAGIVSSLVLALSLVFINMSHAGTPLPPWFNKILNQPEAISGQTLTKRAKAIYNVAVGTNGAVAAHGLGVYLPAKAVITRSWYYVVTATSGTPTSTVAFSCEDANNIKTATDMTAYAANQIVEGASTGAASAFVKSIAAACEITATVAADIMSSGKIDLYIDYTLSE